MMSYNTLRISYVHTARNTCRVVFRIHWLLVIAYGADPIMMDTEMYLIDFSRLPSAHLHPCPPDTFFINFNFEIITILLLVRGGTFSKRPQY